VPDTRHSARRSVSHRIAWAVVGSSILILIISMVLGSWAVLRIDSRSLEREKRSVQIGMSELMARLPVEQDSSAIWDDAVLNARANDEAWMIENMTAWMSEYYGHDQVFVLDPQDKPIRAAISGQAVDASAFEGSRLALGPLVQLLRASMLEASAGLADSTEAVTGLGEIDVVTLSGGRVAIASVRPIVPSTAAVQQAPGTEYLHLSVQVIDEGVAEEIGSKFSLDGLAFATTSTAQPDRMASPVLNRSGRILGFYLWEPDRPASQLVGDMAPMLVLGLLLGAGCVALLLLRLRRTSHELEVSEAHAQFLAFHDSLTRVPNRALFEDRLERALANMRRSNTGIALHYLDLDRFKNVNDTLGHPAGDELIRQVAQRLLGAVREVDTVARLGGDEFAIIQIDAVDDMGVRTLCERVITEVSRPFNLAGDEASVGVSIGVVLADSGEASPKDMMRRADIALYEAKANGRGRYQLFAGELDQQVRERRALERDLRAALLNDGDGLQLVYQPIFAAASQKLVGAEALIRWQHPTNGFMPPDAFIGLAEERGLIDQLGFWVLRNAAAFAVSSRLPMVSVNVSPAQFRDEHFADRVLSTLDQTGLAPRRLEIEITEGLLLQDSPQVRTALLKLRAAGVRVALDDFGTGYSSISYLLTYGVDKLKIDGSFVAQLGQGKDIDNVVKSIIDLGRAMHMQVTAEGVETRSQMDVLLAMNCDQLQGYLLAKPLHTLDLLCLLKAEDGVPDPDTLSIQRFASA
jgi:diguanylate cyclase (GGDEF)-like protein